MNKQPINEFITTLRKANGLTQQEVADRLGISNRTLSSWEQGRAYPDILSLPALAEIYGVTADEILRGERVPAAETELSDKSQKMLFKSRLSHFKVRNIALVCVTAGGALLSLILYFFWPIGMIITSIADAAVVITLFFIYYYNASACIEFSEKEEWTQLHYGYLRQLLKKGRWTLFTAFAVWLACGLCGLIFAVCQFPSIPFFLYFTLSFVFALALLIWYVSESKRNSPANK